MGLPPQLGASSRRVRCRLWVRSQAIHPAAGYQLAAGAITPQAIHFAAGYSSRRGLFISPQAIHFAAGAPGSNCTIAAICRETAMSAPLLENIRPFSTR